MTHQEIQERDLIEAYVRGDLTESDAEAVEDHVYACDSCFDEIQATQKFVEGVRASAESGALKPVAAEERTYHEPRPAFRFAFFAACAAALVLGVAIAWVLAVERPRLEAASAKQKQEAEAAQKRASALEQDLAKLATSAGPASQKNLPLIMLEAARADSSSAVSVPAAAQQLVIWVETPAAGAGATWRMEISTSAGQPVETIDGLVRNSYGALAAGVPASRLTPGDYRARVFVNRAGKSELAGEYRFTVRR